MAEAGKDVRRQYDELAFDNFFQRFNLIDMKDNFIENGFRTCRSLMIVTDDDLKEIGISSLGLRKEVLGAVEEWKKPLLQRAGNTAPERSTKSTPSSTATTPTHHPQSSLLTQHQIKTEYKQSPQLYTPSTGQYSQSPLSRVKEQTPSGSPGYATGVSPVSPGGEKFHRIKRNESCPYPECTWAGLSTHFHCLVCSSFHTNKTERIRRHIQRHEGADNSNDLDEYQKVKREHFFIFGGKECPENCKYAEQGVRHLHCKHCDWRTKKFDSRLLAHFKSHHERHLLQFQASQELESPPTTMANIRTVSPLPTMAVQEAVQIADAQAANHDGTSLPRPPKLMKMETPDGERAVAVHMQQGGYLNRPSIGSEEEGADAASMLEGEISTQSSSKFKCMVCGETQGLRSSLMREQKGRNGPVDWNKTKQLFAYHRTKTTQPAIHWICQKHIEEFTYFSRAYLCLWSTAGVQQHMQHPQQHNIVSPDNETEVSENTLVHGMPVYMMLNEHLSEQYKRDGEEEEGEVEGAEE